MGSDSKAIRNVLVVVLMLGSACAPAASPVDQEGQPGVTRTAPVVTAAPPATPMSADGAQSRFAQPLAVWVTPADAYLSQYPDLSSQPPRCTIPSNTDVQVVSRDVGFRLMILDQATRDRVISSGITGGSAGEDIAEVASANGNCSGYLPAGALQRS